MSDTNRGAICLVVDFVVIGIHAAKAICSAVVGERLFFAMNVGKELAPGKISAVLKILLNVAQRLDRIVVCERTTRTIYLLSDNSVWSNLNEQAISNT